METNLTALEYASREFVRARYESALNTRIGKPGGPLALLATAAGGFARLSGSVERWARRPAGTPVASPATNTQAPAGW